MTLLVRPIIRHTDVVALLEKLLQTAQRDEHTAYQLFLHSRDFFHKKLGIKHWQGRASHVADLQATIKRFGGDFLSHDATATMPSPALGQHPEKFHTYVRQCIADCAETF